MSTELVPLVNRPIDPLANLPWQPMATVEEAVAPEVGSLLETEPLLGTSIEEAFGRQALTEVAEVELTIQNV